MRGNFIYTLLVLLIASSCNQEKIISVNLNPIKADINGDIEELQKQLEKRKTMLVYENSYEGEAKGIKIFYFDDENDSLHYHIEIYTIDHKIKGIEAGLSSKQLTKERLYDKVEKEILPDFESSTRQLDNATTKAERNGLDSTGYYSFEIKTQDLKEKMQ